MDGIRHGFGAALLGLVLGLARPASAEVDAAQVTLTWDAPAGCPTVEQVSAEVDRTLSRLAPPSSPLTVAAQVVPGPGQTWRGVLVLDIHGARSERQLVAESCDVLASATALIIAVALDETRGDPPLAPPSPAADVVAQSIAPLSPTPRGSFFLGVNGIVDDDTMPSPPAAGLEVTAGRRWARGPFRPAAVVGSIWLHNLDPAVNSEIGPVAGTFWMLGLSGRGCLGVQVAKLDIGPCVGGEAVAMHASNSGRATVSLVTDTHYWFSYLGSLGASYRATPTLDLVLRADWIVPTARRTFDILNNVLPAYIVPPAAFRGAFGVAFLFP